MKVKIFLILIILLGLSLRIFQLGNFPKTLYGDEQAFAWNAYSILKYGEDEYGVHMPLQFRSFDDYKAPIPVYLLVPFIKVLGLNAFAIRLPIAIASTLIVISVYFLVKMFFNRKISLLVSFLTGISPWLVHLSRGYFEATLALLFFILGVYFTLKNFASGRNIFFGMIFFALSIYSYFTPRILLPLFLPFLFFFGLNQIQNTQRQQFVFKWIKGVILLFLLSIPLLYATLFQKGFSRFDKLTGDTNTVVMQTVNRQRSTSRLPDFWKIALHNKATVWVGFIINNYLEHLSMNFWYLYGDNSLRYFLGNMGMFYLFEAPFLVIGLFTLWKEKRRAAILFTGWILLAPIPASIVGRSFAVRSIAMLPAPFIIVSYGMYKAVDWIKSRTMKVFTVSVISIVIICSVGFVLIRYYFEYPVYAATWWGWENKAALDKAKENENQYDHIFISDFYTGAPLAFAVYSGYDPREFRYALENPVTMADNRHLIKLGKYYFGSLDIDAKRKQENIIPPSSLYIGRPEEADGDAVITAPDDGRVLFKIYTVN
jgi:4-amino-4-deoxy-L-arabinose transferase-like glycosyltransferase